MGSVSGWHLFPIASHSHLSASTFDLSRVLSSPLLSSPLILPPPSHSFALHRHLQLLHLLLRRRKLLLRLPHLLHDGDVVGSQDAIVGSQSL
jgi:hypothetical protein